MAELKKSLGQHLLIDEDILLKISEELNQFPNHDFLVEVGPGMGALTDYILKLDYSKILLIEKDDNFVEILTSKYQLNNNQIIHDNVLEVNLNNLNYSKLTIAGNYPYNISTQIVFWILDNRDLVIQSLGMFQKEVAKRIASPHGTKEYGILSVLTQAFYQVDYLFDVPPNCFNPPPKVVSGVIKLQKLKEPKADYKKLKTLTKLAFNQRRKMLRNSIKSIIWTDNTLFEQVAEMRPEQLSVDQFCELSKKME